MMSDPKYLRPDDADFCRNHLIEELGEVVIEIGALIAILGKSGRWGLSSYNPDTPPAERHTNASLIRAAMARFRTEVQDMSEAEARFNRHLGPHLMGDPSMRSRP